MLIPELYIDYSICCSNSNPRSDNRMKKITLNPELHILQKVYCSSDELFGDFEDLETGEVHHGEGEDDDEDDNNNEDNDDGGNEWELLFLLQKKIHQ